MNYKKRRENGGSVAVEASIVFPIFIFSLLAMFHIMNAMATKIIVYEALVETGEYMAKYVYLSEKVKENSEEIAESLGYEISLDDVELFGYKASDIISDGTGAIIAKNKFKSFIDETETADKYINGGIDGVSFILSKFPDDENKVEVCATYVLKVTVPFIDSKVCRVQEKVVHKAYLGMSADDFTDVDKEEQYVYITENREAYHTTRYCTYLTRKPGVIDSDRAKEKYKPCEYCVYSDEDEYFVTEYGEKYHQSIACSRLVREIYRVKKSEVAGIPACSKCGGE